MATQRKHSVGRWGAGVWEGQMSQDGGGVLIQRQVDTSVLLWPDEAELEDYGSAGNRLYQDMRAISWETAATLLDLEEALLSEHGWDPYAARQHLSDEDIDNTLWGLDFGVASTVFALSSAGCAPTDSCSGGSGHTQPCPVVKFFSPSSLVPDLLAAASEARCGIVNDDDGSLLVYSATVDDLIRFARTLLSRN